MQDAVAEAVRESRASTAETIDELHDICMENRASAEMCKKFREAFYARFIERDIPKDLRLDPSGSNERDYVRFLRWCIYVYLFRVRDDEENYRVAYERLAPFFAKMMGAGRAKIQIQNALLGPQRWDKSAWLIIMRALQNGGKHAARFGMLVLKALGSGLSRSEVDQLQEALSAMEWSGNGDPGVNSQWQDVLTALGCEEIPVRRPRTQLEMDVRRAIMNAALYHPDNLSNPDEPLHDPSTFYALLGGEKNAVEFLLANFPPDPLGTDEWWSNVQSLMLLPHE